jgi:hypothetical protein
MEAPYANYSRSFINNLNDRQDIVGRPAVKAALYVCNLPPITAYEYVTQNVRYIKPKDF